jgi:hypothetical protein
MSRTKSFIATRFESRLPRVVIVILVLCVTTIVISMIVERTELWLSNYLRMDQTNPLIAVALLVILCFVVLLSINYSGVLYSPTKTLVNGLIAG